MTAAICEPSLKIETRRQKMTRILRVCCGAHCLWKPPISCFGLCAADSRSQMNLSQVENHWGMGSTMDTSSLVCRPSLHQSIFDRSEEFCVLLPRSPCPRHDRPLESARRRWKRLLANLPKDPLQKLQSRLDLSRTSPRSSSDTRTHLHAPTMPARSPPATTSVVLLPREEGL